MDVQHHVKNLISNLNYFYLAKTNVIPDILAGLPTTSSVRFPAWIYALNKTTEKDGGLKFFGTFLENIFHVSLLDVVPVVLFKQKFFADLTDLSVEETAMSIKVNTPTIKVTEKYWEIFVLSAKQSAINISTIEQAVFNKQYGLWRKVVNFARDTGTKYFKDGLVIDYEMKIDGIQAHPDLATGSLMGEIKTTTSSTTKASMCKTDMFPQAILQVLAYVAIGRMTGAHIRYAGLILTMQTQFFLYDLANWDSSKYVVLLMQESGNMNTDITNTLLNQMRLPTSVRILNKKNIEETWTGYGYVDFTQKYGVGSHISRMGGLTAAIEKYPDWFPIQVFMRPNLGGKDCENPTPPPPDLEKARGLIKASGKKLFIHAPYTLILVDPTPLIIEQLKSDLEIGHRIGCLGVVVHVGSYGTNTYESVVNNFEANVRNMLPFASEQCPLLIETPAGEGTDILATLEDMCTFFGKFSTEELKKLGSCIDLCHVFAAGYQPHLYLKLFIEAFPGVLRLIHFNDSKNPRGSRVDRHMLPGYGFIGFDRLEQCAILAKKHGIPMVRE